MHLSSPSENYLTEFLILRLLKTRFDGSHNFDLVGNLNAGHEDCGTFSCYGLPSSFDTKLVDLVHGFLVVQRE